MRETTAARVALRSALQMEVHTLLAESFGRESVSGMFGVNHVAVSEMNS
jgi:hypothetical protein